MHQMLNQSLDQAVKWGKIGLNPVKNANPPSVKREEMKIWAFNEIHSFLEECKSGTYAHLMPNMDNEVADIFHNAVQQSR